MIRTSNIGALVLAGCLAAACDAPAPTASVTPSSAPTEASAPATEQVVAPAITANSVTVDVSRFPGIEGRELVRSSQAIAQDLTTALTRSLSGGAVAGNANVTLQLTSVRLTSPVSAAAFGGPSRIAGILTVTDAADGSVLFGPETVEGTSKTVRVPGAIGVVTSPSAANDYRQTVDGFAASVAELLNPPQDA